MEDIYREKRGERKGGKNIWGFQVADPKYQAKQFEPNSKGIRKPQKTQQITFADSHLCHVCDRVCVPRCECEVVWESICICARLCVSVDACGCVSVYLCLRVCVCMCLDVWGCVSIVSGCKCRGTRMTV